MQRADLSYIFTYYINTCYNEQYNFPGLRNVYHNVFEKVYFKIEIYIHMSSILVVIENRCTPV